MALGPVVITFLHRPQKAAQEPGARHGFEIKQPPSLNHVRSELCIHLFRPSAEIYDTRAEWDRLMRCADIKWDRRTTEEESSKSSRGRHKRTRHYTMDMMSKEIYEQPLLWMCQVLSSLLSLSDLGWKKKCKNAFLKYTAFLCLQYISLATIVTFWINLLSCYSRCGAEKEHRDIWLKHWQ